MTKEIRMTVTAPCECTDEQFEEWVKFSLGYQSSIPLDNPLSSYDLEANYVDI